MNKATFAAFKAVQAAGSYGYDPFEGLPVVFNNTITAYAAATTGVTFAIVGDFAEGAIANFPNGEEITIKYDDLSLAEKDLVKLVGRQYIGLDVIGPKSFVKISKAAAAG
jgi:HK97 family phage major capsid protein